MRPGHASCSGQGRRCRLDKEDKKQKAVDKEDKKGKVVDKATKKVFSILGPYYFIQSEVNGWSRCFGWFSHIMLSLKEISVHVIWNLSKEIYLKENYAGFEAWGWACTSHASLQVHLRVRSQPADTPWLDKKGNRPRFSEKKAAHRSRVDRKNWTQMTNIFVVQQRPENCLCHKNNQVAIIQV